MSLSRAERATSFGAWADEYHDSRPSYPDAAVTWLLSDAQRVTEVGAGTGKLTDRLVEVGHVQLTVTEVDERMLSLIKSRHPTLPLYEADATNLPVTDGSVDAVLVADAWQWFPKEKAATEVNRVLRADGWLGCVWNDLALTTPDWVWSAMQLSPDIADRVRRMGPQERLGLTNGAADQETFRWTWHLTPSQFGAYMATLSHVRTLPQAQCQSVVAEAVRQANDACDARRASTVAIEFDAVCISWRA